MNENIDLAGHLLLGALAMAIYFALYGVATAITFLMAAFPVLAVLRLVGAVSQGTAGAIILWVLALGITWGGTAGVASLGEKI